MKSTQWRAVITGIDSLMLPIKTRAYKSITSARFAALQLVAGLTYKYSIDIEPVNTNEE